MTSIICFFTYNHDNFKFGFKQVISDLTTLSDLSDPKWLIKWWANGNHVILELFWVLFMRIIMFLSFSTAAIPFGIFTPGLMIGCIIGRIYGEVCTWYFGIATDIRVFAVCSAAAYISTVTKTFSPWICVLEMTG